MYVLSFLAQLWKKGREGGKKKRNRTEWKEKVRTRRRIN
jgi:hypothetical protein